MNSDAAITRQRFTAAHELGHAFLEPEATVERFEADLATHEDWQANRFAAHFLMDEASVRDVVAGADDPTHKVLLVVAGFEVSLNAAAIHLQRLVIIGPSTVDDVLRAREKSSSLTALGKRYDVSIPSWRRDGAIDLGPEYELSLRRLHSDGLIVGERFHEMSRLELRA